MANLKELSKKPERFTNGHRACAGCGAPIAIRQFLAAQDVPVIVGSATGCMEVISTIFPFTAWNVPFIHTAFESAAATVSGVEAAYKSLKRHGKYDKDVRFIAMGGDGGTYDIGFQSLSGAMERGHRMLYICYDNNAYMNTGIQRSSATPMGADSTTAPVGKARPAGKQQNRKDLTACMVAHEIPYVAQANIAYWNDFISKVQKALAVDGPSFINVLSPCPLGWRFKPEKTIELAKGAVETCFWPLYEVVDGEYKITVKPREKKPVADWLKEQGRFRHLFKPGNEEVLETIQNNLDKKWDKLKKLAGEE